MPVQECGFVQRITCPACESPDYTSIFSTPFEDNRIWGFLDTFFKGRIPKERIIGQKYEIVKCVKCAMLWQSYILDDNGMRDLYADWIDAQESLAKREAADRKYYINMARSIFIASSLMPKDSKTMLDFGMGWGHWCMAANALGMEAWGLELSPERQDFARNRNVKVITDLSTVPDNFFGFINSDQVFEHIPNPRESLKSIARIMRTGGVLHAAVPNGEDSEKALASKNFKMKKGALQPLEHINTFTPATLKAMCESTGLKLIKPIILPYLADCVMIKDAGSIPDPLYLALRKTSLYFVKK